MKSMNCIVCLSLLALLLANKAESTDDEKLSISWLAKYFKVDPNQTVEETVPAEPRFPDKDEPVDQSMLDRRQVVGQKYLIGKYEEVLVEGEILAKDIIDQIKETNNKNLAHLLSDIYIDMHRAANMLKQYPRSLLVALKLRDVCVYLDGCDARTADAFLVLDEENFKSLDNYAKLGLTHQATIRDVKRAYRGLMVLVHPDRHFDLDDESRKYLEELFIQLRAAYLAIINPSNSPERPKERKLISADYLNNKQQ